MSRPERPVDPSDGPVQAFAVSLRTLRERAGNPKYLQMARATGRSRTALAEAAGGDHVPTWETVEAYVKACGGDLIHWRLQWEQLVEQAHRQPVQHLLSPAPQKPSPRRTSAGAISSDSLRNDHFTVMLSAIIAVISVSIATFVHQPLDSGQAPEATLTPERSVLITDTEAQPVALSTRPSARCVELGCTVPAIDLWPGDRRVVFCYTAGDLVRESQHDFLGPGPELDRRSPSSNGWYGSRLPDGRTGYLPEVYVTPEERGGLGLPRCESVAALEPR